MQPTGKRHFTDMSLSNLCSKKERAVQAKIAAKSHALKTAMVSAAALKNIQKNAAIIINYWQLANCN